MKLSTNIKINNYLENIKDIIGFKKFVYEANSCNVLIMINPKKELTISSEDKIYTILNELKNNLKIEYNHLIIKNNNILIQFNIHDNINDFQIGEKFTYKNITLEIKENKLKNCDQCYFKEKRRSTCFKNPKDIPACSSFKRNDNKSVYFKLINNKKRIY